VKGNRTNHPRGPRGPNAQSPEERAARLAAGLLRARLRYQAKLRAANRTRARKRGGEILRVCPQAFSMTASFAHYHAGLSIRRALSEPVIKFRRAGWYQLDDFRSANRLLADYYNSLNLRIISGDSQGANPMKKAQRGDPMHALTSPYLATLSSQLAGQLLDLLDTSAAPKSSIRDAKDRQMWLAIKRTLFLMGDGPNLFGSQDENRHAAHRHAELYAKEVFGNITEGEAEELRQLQQRITAALDDKADERADKLQRGELRSWFDTE
jgi:hypothetical protein